MFAHLVSTYHLHPIVDHFTIALLTFGIAAEILAAAAIPLSRDRPGFVSVWGQKLRSSGELVYEHGVGMARRTVNAQQIRQPSEDKLTIGKER